MNHKWSLMYINVTAFYHLRRSYTLKSCDDNNINEHAKLKLTQDHTRNAYVLSRIPGWFDFCVCVCVWYRLQRNIFILFMFTVGDFVSHNTNVLVFREG